VRRGAAAFTLIEVMLSVAVFAFAAVGFAVALNEVMESMSSCFELE